MTSKISILLGLVLIGIITSARGDVIKGRVLNEQNQPIKNAEVLAVTLGDTLGRLKYHSVQTDAAGRFQVDMRSEYKGMYGRIYATAPGMAPIGIYVGQSNLHKENLLQLQPATTVSGRIVDGNGNAVSGVMVQLQVLAYSDDSSVVFLENTPWENRFQAITDKKGKWELHCVPQNARAGIVINDPRFVKTIIRVTSDSSPPTTQVRPGAILTGRVITRSGKPAADIFIYAQSQDDTHRTVTTKTTADGSYRLTGLSNGMYNITADASDQAMVARTLVGQTAREGKTIHLSDIKLISGGVIKGQILNGKTGQPIPGIKITSHNTNDPKGRIPPIGSLTDDKGYYSIRVIPGENQVYLMSANSYFQGKEFSKIFDVKEDQTITHNIVLKPFEVLSGTVVDEKGNPVPDIKIVVSPFSELLSAKTGHGVMTISDDKGNWKADGLIDGEMMVRAVDPWRNLQPVKVTVPHTGTIHLTVQNINSLPPTGRVVDINNQPLKNITLQLQYQLPISESGREVSRYQDVTSDENGYIRFTAPPGTQTVVVYRINNSKYQFVRGSVWDANKQHLSDVVLDKLDNVVRGKVLDADGKPAENVRVQAAGFDHLITHSNSTGSFELRGLPHQHFALLAVSGKTVAKSSGGARTLRLKPIEHNLPSRKQALDMLESLWNETTYIEFPGRLGIISTIAKDDSTRAFRLLRDRTEPIPASQISDVISLIAHSNEADVKEMLNVVMGKITEEDLYYAIDQLAKSHPALVLQWSEKHIRELADEIGKVKVLCKIAELTMATDKLLAQKYFSRAQAIATTFPVPAQKTYSRDISKDSPMGRFLFSRVYLAAASVSVHPEQTRQWIMQIVPYSVDAHRGSRGDYDAVRDILTQKLVEAGATQEVQYLIAHSSPNLQYMELGSAVSAAIAANDMNAAQEYLDQLLQMYRQKGAIKPSSFITPEYVIDSAVGTMIDAVVETNPARALRLARMLEDKDQLGRALMLAVQYQPKEKALETYEEAYSLLESEQLSPQIWCKLMATFYDFAPIKGKVLLDELLESNPVVRQITSYPGSVQASDLAVALARYKPAIGWLFLQNVWANNITSTDSQSHDLGSIALAMSQIDFNQSMMWARNIPGRQWGTNELDVSLKYDVQLAILRNVLDPKQRFIYTDIL